jgi:AcrR family transcriptional regulator
VHEPAFLVIWPAAVLLTHLFHKLPAAAGGVKEGRRKMARPADSQRQARTLAAAADYVLGHGLAGLSLRPLAAALGTSPRMLLYDFTSKEELIMTVLTEVRRRMTVMLADYVRVTGASGADLVRAVWDWASSAERAPFMRLSLEVYVEAMTNPGAYSERGRAMVTEWLDQFATALVGATRVPDPTSATLVIAVLRGLMLDRFSTGDERRTDLALERFAQLLEP